ncbi:hypothetical protein [Zavarzinella formosa]|uniref:hypothetical protein n=1 Tax=Zavarzinella formosa TaxID=360055 RepID=UPI001EE66CE9|nr:hypothetical protein [Zavarzinella formosa]
MGLAAAEALTTAAEALTATEALATELATAKLTAAELATELAAVVAAVVAVIVPVVVAVIIPVIVAVVIVHGSLEDVLVVARGNGGRVGNSRAGTAREERSDLGRCLVGHRHQRDASQNERRGTQNIFDRNGHD